MILGIVGFINSGKGTIGDVLESKGFKKDSFAAPLKDAAAKIFGWDRDMLEGNTEASRTWREYPDQFWSTKFGYDFSPRKALQWLGTESCRDVFHKDIWAFSLLNRIQKDQNVVVTDVRFKNEISILRDSGAKIVRVSRGFEPEWYNIALLANRGNQNAIKTMNEKYNHIHISEWDWIGSEIDYIIRNDSTLEEFKKQINIMLDCLCK